MLYSDHIDIWLKSGELITLKPVRYGRYWVTYGETGFPADCREFLDFVEKIINGDMERLKILRLLGSKYKGWKTIYKYLDIFLDYGEVRSSRELTKILSMWAFVRNKSRAFGFETDDYWLFTGRCRQHRSEWCAYVVKKDMSDIYRYCNDDVRLKIELLNALGGKPSRIWTYLRRVEEKYELDHLARDSQYWGLGPLIEAAAIYVMAKALA